MSTVFTSQIPWGDHRRKADTLVIRCSAYDFRPYFAEFIVDGLGLEEYDLISVPGGIEVLTMPGKLQTALLTQIRFLIQKHGLTRVIVVGHDDCGWYRHKHPTSSFGGLKELQVVHLQGAVAMIEKEVRELEELEETTRSIAIELYYGNIDTDKGEVTFESVPHLF